MRATGALTCYRVDCRGDFEPRPDSSDVLYSCAECGCELARGPTETLADGTGPIADLAGVLLEGAK